MRGIWQPTIDVATQKMFDDAHDAEPSAVARFLRGNPGWGVNQPKPQLNGTFTRETAYTDTTLPFPNFVTCDAIGINEHEGIIAPLEIKRPRFNRGIEFKWVVQNTMQCALTGAPYGFIILDPVWGEAEFFKQEFNPALWEHIIADCEHFWNLVQTNTPPDVEYSENLKDIQKFFHPTPQGPPVEVPHELGERYLAYREAHDRLEQVKADIIQIMEGAPQATFMGDVIAERKLRFSGKHFKENNPQLAKQYTHGGKLNSALLKVEHPEAYESSRIGTQTSFI